MSSGAVTLVNPVGAVGRHWRRPKHPFQLRTRPYVLQPFLLAPVLPGETFKHGVMQARVVSDPIKNPLIGWWKEYYFFYVKLRDMAASADLQKMLVTPGFNMAAHKQNVQSVTYRGNSSMDWIYMAMEPIVREYFRDEGETWNVNLRDQLPLAQAFGDGSNWADSLTLDVNVPDVDPNDASAVDLEQQQLTWEFMRAQKLTNLSFEDFLRTFGVHGVEESQKPELLRYVKEWTYPANTVGSDGSVNSALSWSIQERIDKDRYFKEHGFIVGITTTRPKIYMKNQIGLVSGYMDSAFNWLPAVLRDRMETSLKQFTEGQGPAPNILNGAGDGSYWIDVKDLFLYGEQYINFALTATDANLVSLPNDTGGIRYVADADVDAMFKVGANNYVKEDGVVQLAILGASQETT